MPESPKNNPVIREIIRQGKRLPKPVRDRYMAAALETGRIESNFKNVGYGDADSVNWRQERASIYGGDMSIRRSVARFYKEAMQHDKGQPSYELAADVQRPAEQYRGRYRDAHGEAMQLLKGAGSTAPSHAPQSPSQPAGKQYTTQTTPGVDNSGLRLRAVGEFLQQGGVKNPNAVLGLAGQYGQLQDVPGVTTQIPVQGTTAPKVKAPKQPKSGPLPKDGKNNWGVLEHAGQSGLYLQEKYGIKEIGGYRANDPFPDHPSRKALDLMVYDDTRKGSQIARELTRNHKQHRVKYLIWNQRIWHPGEGWRKMEDRGSPTQNHKDHVHVLYE